MISGCQLCTDSIIDDYICLSLKFLNVEIISTEFISSYTNVDACPNVLVPEYAFIGRSNVGKSSLINMLLQDKKLAKISNTPGKTQLINYFLVNDSWYLVDLPGYGYAKVSKSLRKKWMKMIKTYLERRKSLMCTYILIDSRHNLQKIDLDFINWMGESQLPFYLIFTKTDKVKKNVNENILLIKEELLHYWHELPKSFVSSAKSNLGREEILLSLEHLNEQFKLMI